MSYITTIWSEIMSLPEHNEKPDESLTDKIDELDSLLNDSHTREDQVPILSETASNSLLDDSNIPILDDPVSFEDLHAGNENQQRAGVTGTDSDQLTELIDNIEHRLTSELESMVNTIKSSMKESILNELKQKIEQPSGKTGNKPDHKI